MTEEVHTGWQKDAVKPSMKRRMADKDYTERSIYMVTVATEGRRPLFGMVVGRADVPAGQVDAPRIELTPLGQRVLRSIGLIPRFHPKVSIIASQVMPDHVHIILFVRERMDVPLGRVVNGFKVGCNRAYRELMGKGGGCSPQCGEQRGQGEEGKEKGKEMGEVKRDREHGMLFETGYHDRVLRGGGQLQRMIDYVHDNPRRMLMKRGNWMFFRREMLEMAGRRLYAYGNLSLLHREKFLPVKCSRRWSAEETQRHVADCLAQAHAGAVLVSPFISPGEKTVEKLAMEQGLPFIKLTDNGFPDYYKPTGRYFEACANGCLLLITPYDYHTERIAITRVVCNELNELALWLCRSGDALWRTI